MLVAAVEEPALADDDDDMPADGLVVTSFVERKPGGRIGVAPAVVVLPALLALLPLSSFLVLFFFDENRGP